MSRVYVESNIDSVIDSVKDVADDIRHEIRRRVGRVMRALKSRVVQYIRQDSDYRGGLVHSIHTTSDITDSNMEFTVATDSDIAPYAAIVEYGSGKNTNIAWSGSETPPPPDAGSSTPPKFPYDSASSKIDTPPEDKKYRLTGYPKFAGFVGHIEEWMKKKPVTANSGDIFTSAVAIAYEIITNGNLAHPFMRPAWFDKELQVRKAARNAIKNATR